MSDPDRPGRLRQLLAGPPAGWLLITTLALLVPCACGLDLGEIPFLCNNKGKPECPDGYQCRSGKCVKEGTCPASIPECTTVVICGNGKCDSGETAASCPADCKPATCGNGKCDSGETVTSCPADCKPATCGNGKCDSGETATSCPVDCKPTTCGNGKCDSSETSSNCPADCTSTCTGTQSECDGTDKLKYCDKGVLKTDTCKNLCLAAAYDYDLGCKNDPSSGKDVCYCDDYSQFGELCDDTNVKCAANLLCVSFTGATTGFCTKECSPKGSVCQGGPSGTQAMCDFTLKSTGKSICGFTCSLSSCPSKMSCDYSDFYCKP